MSQCQHAVKTFNTHAPLAQSLVTVIQLQLQFQFQFQFQFQLQFQFKLQLQLQPGLIQQQFRLSEHRQQWRDATLRWVAGEQPARSG